jgi:hypothetical protein
MDTAYACTGAWIKPPLTFGACMTTIAWIAGPRFCRGGYRGATIEGNGEVRFCRDGLGRTMKLSQASAALPLPLDEAG